MKSAEDFLAQLGVVISDSALEAALPPEGIGYVESVESPEAQTQRQKLLRRIENKAVALLAIREHGAKELHAKLLTKFPETDALLSEYGISPGLVKELVSEVLQLCQTNDWQSDERYIAQAVRSLTDKGQGPLKIRQKLQQTCVREDLISAYLDWDDADWLALAQEVLLKKYSELTKPASHNEQGKRMRFLQSRGFPPQVIWKAFR